MWYFDHQALYDTSSADHNSEMTASRQQTSGPETVAELQHRSSDDISNRCVERRGEPVQPNNGTSSR